MSSNFSCGTEKAKVVARKASISSISDVVVAVVETNTVKETVAIDDGSSHGGVVTATTKKSRTTTTTILAAGSSSSSSLKKIVPRRSSSSLKKIVPRRSSSSLEKIVPRRSSSSLEKHNKNVQSRTSPHVPQGVATKKSTGFFGCCSPTPEPQSEDAILITSDKTAVIHGEHGDIVANEHHDTLMTSNEIVDVEEHWVAGEDSDGNQVMVKATETNIIERSNSSCPKAKKHHKKRHVNQDFDGPLIMADSPRIVLGRTLCGKKGRSSSDEVDVVAVKTTTTTAVAVDTDGDNVADAFVYTEKTQTAVAVDTDGDNVADAVLVTEKNEAVVVAGRSSSSL